MNKIKIEICFPINYSLKMSVGFNKAILFKRKSDDIKEEAIPRMKEMAIVPKSIRG